MFSAFVEMGAVRISLFLQSERIVELTYLCICFVVLDPTERSRLWKIIRVSHSIRSRSVLCLSGNSTPSLTLFFILTT